MVRPGQIWRRCVRQAVAFLLPFPSSIASVTSVLVVTSGIVAALLTPNPASAVPVGETPIANAVLVEEGPTIDGVLDDAIWEKAEVITDLTMVEPTAGAPPSFRSEIRILTDGKTLYFSLRAYDPEPDKIVANRMARTEMFFYDDGFNMLLDTFHDRRSGFFFQVNPNGGRRDGTFEGDSYEENWDGIWYANSRIDELGWTTEVAIPFKTLGFDEGQDVWGLNLSRRVRRFNEENRWADPTLERFGINMSRAGELHGMAVAKQGVGLDVVPAFSFGGQYDELNNRKNLDVEPSFDAFYRVLPSLTASVTANTDFAQTEVDDAQVNFTRFELFFPEKREFFLRDTGIFSFGGLRQENGLPFFSRRIGLGEDGSAVRLLGGGRVTGRAGRFRLGFLNIQQDEAQDVDATNITVARVSANVLEESTLGVLLTHGDPNSNEENLLAATDFNFRSSQLIPNRFVSGEAWYQQTLTQSSGGSDYGRASSAWGGTLSYPNDKINWKVRFKSIEENFDPALGFVTRAGIRRYDGEYRYRFRPETSIRTWDLTALGNVVTDRDDNVESFQVFVTPIRITTQVDDVFSIRFNYLYDKPSSPYFIVPHVGLPSGAYSFPSATALVSTSRHRPLRLEFDLGIGALYDGWAIKTSPTVEWRPSKHWLVSLYYEDRQVFSMKACQGFTRDDTTGLCTSDAASPILRTVDFQTRLVRFRVQFTFNPDTTLSTLAQYSNMSNGVSVQTRLRWIIEPGREFFFVIGQTLDATPGDFRVKKTEPVVKLRWTLRF
ncbi:MAG: hypothetical protein CL908_17330 [Deltaproteobacteria bacterium]|nr:hypothetical protein [Deltaproteobacteria bacterium]